MLIGIYFISELPNRILFLAILYNQDEGQITLNLRLNFLDIEKYLVPNHFVFSAVEPNGGFRNIFEGHMFAVDALYFNKKFK